MSVTSAVDFKEKSFGDISHACGLDVKRTVFGCKGAYKAVYFGAVGTKCRVNEET